MANRIVLLSLFITSICRAQQGVDFKNGLTWDEVKIKAKNTGKFIFIDAYKAKTSDFRNKQIYSNPEVGNFVNNNFISIQIQIDSSEFDKEEIKRQYSFAHEIYSLLNKDVFPAYIFFDSLGQLVHAYPLGSALSAKRLLEEAKNALETNHQYFTLLSQFEKGTLPYSAMPSLVKNAQTLRDRVNAVKIADKYSEEFIFNLPQMNQLSKENISMIALSIKSSSDKGFVLFRENSQAIDSIMQAKDYTNNIVEDIISRELVHLPQRTSTTPPDWKSLYLTIKKKFGPEPADRVTLSSKIIWYESKKDWTSLIEAFLIKTEKYGYDTTWLGKSNLNNIIYEIVFKNSSNKIQLQQASEIMEKLLKTNSDKTSWLDTYANLLYKATKTKEAIAVEERAVRLDPNDQDLQQTLQKMKEGKPTWTINESNSDQLTTRWSEEISTTNVLPEYPRPQMVRTNWTNLNGFWDYAITDSSNKNTDTYIGKILVPYPLESSLSKVQKILKPEEKLWYRKTINLKEKEKNKRYLLHFGAVDYSTKVLVNGSEVGYHTGGFQEFTCDITNQIRKGTNRIVVSVLDPTDKGNNPHGKQVLEPSGIMYTSTSGIWQTVWLETVPVVYIESLKFIPDIDNGLLKLQVTVHGASDGYTIEAIANNAGSVKGDPNTLLVLPVSNPHLWSPNDPYLYQLSVKLSFKDKVADTVRSYFGMRKIEIKKDEQGQEKIFLNNRYTFNMGVLDQGYWPDGIYTAPTDNALRSDIETIKSMGFNMIRKHIKIEPARWYYWCDQLGMLVWQDMPFPANLSAEAKTEFEKENDENIKQLYNYSSIVCWILFNEGWNRYDQGRLTTWMKQADPTRLIDGHSGENYDRKSPALLKDKWINSDMTDIHDYPGPQIAPYIAGKARVLGEWGGVRVATPGHQWNNSKSWGYMESNKADFANKYEFMVRHLKLFEEEGLSAAIYTQPFDVEIEENGLITYDRKIFKIPVDKIRKINNVLSDNLTPSNLTKSR